jgi:hypothetical protein
MQMITHVQTSVQSIKIKTNVFANMLLVEKGCSNLNGIEIKNSNCETFFFDNLFMRSISRGKKYED